MIDLFLFCFHLDYCEEPLVASLPPTSFQSSSRSSDKAAPYFAKLNRRDGMSLCFSASLSCLSKKTTSVVCVYVTRELSWKEICPCQKSVDAKLFLWIPNIMRFRFHKQCLSAKKSISAFYTFIWNGINQSAGVRQML